MNEPAERDSRFSPRDFLRARRPEKFSDSIPLDRPILDRATLEYHLITVTSRSEETLFEEFARQLLQKEVVPNLKPHTGPTGGGDSKVDSETYPVAEAIAAGWYVGVGGKSDTERWAVAISAKKDWRPKVRSDVASLSGTGRGYVKAFFVSNQLIPDKQRASEEDALTAKHGIELHIFDLNWLLDKVFNGRHEELAIATLNIKVRTVSEKRQGPQDLERERDLEALETSIKEQLQGAPTLSLADDTLEAAVLARGLDRPRTEVEGLFARAQRAAMEYGTEHQQALAYYEHAWTAYFWYEDLPAFVKFYEQVETVVNDSPNAHDTELLTNLWMILATAAREAHIAADAARVPAHTAILRQTLQKIAAHTERPSSSLRARQSLAMISLTEAMPRVLAEPLRELRKIVDEADGLIGYPLLELAELISELSQYFVGNHDFEELFNALVATTGKRQGEVAGARMLLRLGAQQLDAAQPYDAIRTLGRVLASLYKHESRSEMVRALTLIGSAYERVGLLWAARGTILNAASIATNQWWGQSEITLAQHRCYNRMKWIELQLGRLPQLLSWHELDYAVRRLLMADGYPEDALSQWEKDFDGILAILLLRADVWQLKQLERLPDALARRDLPIASLALQFALGHDEDIESGGETVSAKDQSAAFETMSSQPAAAQLPPAPVLYNENTQKLESVIVGCKVEVVVDNRWQCIQIGESFLSATESLLATSILKGFIPRVSQFRVRVRHSDFATFPFTHDGKDEEGEPLLEVRAPLYDRDSMPREQQAELKDELFKIVAAFLGRAFHIDGSDSLRQLFGEERGMDRALGFTGSFGAVTNTLGEKPKLSIAEWDDDTNTRYELRRSEVWDADQRRVDAQASSTRKRREEYPAHGDGQPPEDLLQMKGVKHSDFAIETVIRESLWNSARWRGVIWAVYEAAPPLMVLGFQDGMAAAEIMTYLIRDIGKDDAENRLRISIIRGISKRKPFSYRVIIGSNWPMERQSKFGAVMFRIQTMEPPSNENLERFLEAYKREGGFRLGVTEVDPKAPVPSPPLRAGLILKRELQVREAWQIGRNDIDGSGVDPSDDVNIPAGREHDALDLIRIGGRVSYVDRRSFSTSNTGQ